LLLGLTLSLAWAATAPIDDAYSTVNTQSNGTSELAARGFVSVYPSLELALPNTYAPAVLLEIGPSSQFTKADTDSIRGFLARGGVILVADNFGSGNGLLELLGIPARFDGRLLADSLFYQKQTVFPSVSVDLPAAGVKELVLDHGTVLNITDRAAVSVLASSSPFSFLDLNHDGLKDPKDPSGPFPILAELTVGSGSVILFTSPGSLTNDMIDEGSNSLLIKNIIQRASQLGGGTPTLLVDETHLERSVTLFTSAKLFARGLVTSIIYGGMGVPDKLGLALLAMLVVAVPYVVETGSAETEKEPSKPYRTVPRFDTDAVIKLHPTWDRRQVEYVSRELEASMKWRHPYERE
jgi:hypothetical protein